jgi:hypothetical protein
VTPDVAQNRRSTARGDTSWYAWRRAGRKLAFQGNIRQWPEADYEIVKSALEETAGQTA